MSLNSPSVSPSETKQPFLSAGQWAILIGMGLVLVLVFGLLLVVLRSVNEPDVMIELPTTDPRPLPLFVPDAVPTPTGLYWPPSPQPLETPNAPGGLLWWDARWRYRRAVVLDAIAAESPAGTWARVLFDGQSAQQEGKMRSDGGDLRLLVWDSKTWWEIPRLARPLHNSRGWEILFHIQNAQLARAGAYYLYYGNPTTERPPVAEDAPDTSRLLLMLDPEQGVEWGPTVTWFANSPQPQKLVSPDGRIVILCPPGGPRADVQVRLRTVPLAERPGVGALPDWELHADPPPLLPESPNLVRWSPRLIVSINWAGLAVDQRDLVKMVHFEHDPGGDRWYSIPVEWDERTGITRMITEQP